MATYAPLPRFFSLRDPACLDAARFGNKAAGLARLAVAGYPVPEGISIPIDTDLDAARGEIIAALGSLPRPWAVRSSSTAEDAPATAFPGIFDTVLGIDDADRAIQAIRQVRHGVNSPRVEEYIRRHSIMADTIKMGVVIQSLVNPDAAGTVFTRNPANNDNEIVIESTFGLGEPLVSGEITPDRIAISPNGEIKRRDIGTKIITIRPAAGSTFTEETPESLRSRLSLSDAEALGIARMAQRIASDFDAPQDIEWAIKDGEIFILQARPITAFGNELDETEVRTLSVITSHDDWDYYVTRKFCWFIESTQIAATDQNLHLSTIGFPYPMDRYAIVNGDEYGCKANDILLHECLTRYEAERQDFFAGYAARLRAIAVTARDAARHLLSQQFTTLNASALALKIDEFSQAYILSFVPTWTRPDSYLEAKVRKLLSPLGEDSSAELLYAIARSVDLDSLEYSREPLDLLRVNEEYFRNEHVPPDFDDLEQAQKDALGNHAATYGWQRAPLGSTLQTFTEKDYLARIRLARDKGVDARQAIRRIEHDRQDSAAFLRSSISSLADPAAAESLVETLRTFIYLRTFTTEASDYLFFAGKHKLFSEVSRRLEVTLDVLLMCNSAEIGAGLLGEVSREALRDLARERERGYAIVWDGGVPVTVLGRSVRAIDSTLRAGSAPAKPAGATIVITGQSASPGRARGRVRIVLSGEQSEAMELGEVLVTSMTNPDLVLAMEKASAIVTDEGGITCHAAITARELGVPCVIGTGNATSLLPDRALVNVDAEVGTVEVL